MAGSDFKRVIVVEGEADLHVVLHLLRKIHPNLTCGRVNDHTFALWSFGESEIQIRIRKEKGIDQICKGISARLKEPATECVGFIFDADTDPKRRWKQVREKILDAYGKPQTVTGSMMRKAFCDTPVREGVWITDCEPKVGVWMMPNNQHAGTIEDFLSDMIYPQDYCWKHAKDYVGTVLKEKAQFPKHEIFPKTKQMKANIHAWLAVQKNPGAFPGEAIKFGYLNSKTPKIRLFQEWLGNLPKTPKT